jgi:hypothetical protein
MSLPGLLNQLITLYPKSSYDSSGREVVGSGTNYKCRFQETTKRKMLPNGSLLTIDAIAYVQGNPTVSTDDRVSYGGNYFKIFAKYAAVDGQGNVNHLKLELLKWQS